MSRVLKKYGKHKNKKSERLKAWMVGALTDLGVGIILILIQRFLD